MKKAGKGIAKKFQFRRGRVDWEQGTPAGRITDNINRSGSHYKSTEERTTSGSQVRLKGKKCKIERSVSTPAEIRGGGLTGNKRQRG